MGTVKNKRIEVDLPEDIIFVMRSVDKPEKIKKNKNWIG